MKATFIGDPLDDYSGPDVFTLHGCEFIKGEPVDIDDTAFAARLRTNSHFRCEDAPQIIEPVAETDPLESKTKTELEILGRQYGIELDRRRRKDVLIDQVREAMNADHD